MPKISPEEIQSAYDSVKYSEGLKRQENSKIYNYPEDKLIFINKAPEDNGGSDIAYGHKLTKKELKDGTIYGIEYKNGITKEDAAKILELDIIKHRNKAEDKVGSEEWSKLPETGKALLTDYSFTGTLSSFPKMIKGLLNRDKSVVLKEYPRKFRSGGTMKDMVERNKFSRELIESMGDYWK